MLYNECVNQIRDRRDVIFPAVRKLFDKAGYSDNIASVLTHSVIDTVNDFVSACGNLTDSDEWVRTDAVRRLFNDINTYCFPDIRLCIAEKFGFSLSSDEDEMYIETPGEEEFRKIMMKFGETESVPFAEFPPHSDLLSVCEEAVNQFLELKEGSKKTHNIDGLKPTAKQIFVSTAINSLEAEAEGDYEAVKMIRGIGILHIAAYAVGYGKKTPEDVINTIRSVKASVYESEKELLKNFQTRIESTDAEISEEEKTVQESDETEEETES